MIKSMTGFGRSEYATKDRKIVVEIKSVNHRYCDISIKMPKKLSFFETSIRNLLKKYIQRGKVDVFITYEDYTENKVCVKYNEDIAREYFNQLVKMSEEFGIENDVKATALSRYPEVLTLEEQTIDEEELWTFMEKAIVEASEKFVKTRIEEGERLKTDIFAKLDGMNELVSFIEKRSPEIVAAYRDRIIEKVNELLGDNKVDEVVMATEITMFADKICVDEETVRLRSHISSMEETLEEGVGIGRKLDFIAQEMNREANTILSKANDLEVSNKAINLKTEIEKIREQIQNIE
ncbi:YicC family protein [Lachnospiraceae bacterium KM106-2]|nr:YicC family protein [Lachnospiraceae bacterium KM106-2]